MSNEIIIILMWIALLVGIIGIGAPLGFVLGSVGVIAGFIGWEGISFLDLFPLRIFGIISNYVLVAVPLFVFMGYMLERAGFGEDLFGGVELFFGRIRGGMALSVVMMTTAIAATTGVVATGVIMAGVLALPVMLRQGYDKGLALGTVAAGGTLGVLIPPSTLLVFYASQTSLSVGKLFLGAFGPGLILSALFMIYIAIISTLRPKMAPRKGEVPERTEYKGVKHQVTSSSRLKTLASLLPVVFLIFAVLGTIIIGVATPTEAAACGALGAIIVSAIYRKLNLRTLFDACTNTLGTMGMFGGVTIGAMCFTAIFSGLGGRQIVYGLLTGLGVNPLSILLIILGIVFLLGMFIDPIAILLIIIPTVVPLAETMGWDQLWFGMLICVVMQTAWLSPPFGYALFFLKGLNLPGIAFSHIAKGCVPFILLQLIGVGACIAFPQVVLWLPNLLIK